MLACVRVFSFGFFCNKCYLLFGVKTENWRVKREINKSPSCNVSRRESSRWTEHCEEYGKNRSISQRSKRKRGKHGYLAALGIITWTRLPAHTQYVPPGFSATGTNILHFSCSTVQHTCVCVCARACPGRAKQLRGSVRRSSTGTGFSDTCTGQATGQHDSFINGLHFSNAPWSGMIDGKSSLKHISHAYKAWSASFLLTVSLWLDLMQDIKQACNILPIARYIIMLLMLAQCCV